MYLWDGIILSRVQLKTRIVVTCLIIVITTCMISVSIFCADAAQYTSADIIQPYAAAVTGTASSDDESEILSSQDWEALLNVSSEESEPVSSETTDVIASPLKNGMSGDSFFIWGCIAIGLGVLGIAFFIYSQFIYKHMKTSSDTESDYHEKQTEAAIPKRGDSFKEQISKEKTQEKQDFDKTLGKTSEAQLDDIDWDKFFEEHKNQNNNDK